MKFDGLVFEIGIMLGAGMLVGGLGMYGVFQGLEWIGKKTIQAARWIAGKIKAKKEA